MNWYVNNNGNNCYIREFFKKNKVKSRPLVSVIVNCHNGEEYLENCIKSILNQSFKNFELFFGIIVPQIIVRKLSIVLKTKELKNFFQKIY